MPFFHGKQSSFQNSLWASPPASSRIASHPNGCDSHCALLHLVALLKLARLSFLSPNVSGDFFFFFYYLFQLSPLGSWAKGMVVTPPLITHLTPFKTEHPLSIQDTGCIYVKMQIAPSENFGPQNCRETWQSLICLL